MVFQVVRIKNMGQKKLAKKEEEVEKKIIEKYFQQQVEKNVLSSAEWPNA